MGMIWGLLKWVIRLGIVVLAITTVAVVYKSYDMRSKHLDGASLVEPVDAIIVLGGNIDADHVPALNSRRRVALGLELVNAGKAQALIITGGNSGPDPEKPSAAKLMEEYAIASLGARPEQILLEERAVSTFENIRFAFELAEAEGYGSVAILTDAYHLTRAQALATHFGKPDVPLIAAGGVEDELWVAHYWWFVREAMAWWLNVGKVGGWEMLDAIGIETERAQELIR